MSYCILGLNSERMDMTSRTCHLGNGYRDYNPVLMRFNRPDSWSPFGLGGMNCYTYCASEPVNNADPSGHMSWQSISGIVSGVIGLALIPFTLGQSLTVVTCIIAGTEAIAGITSIVSAVLQDNHPNISSVLGWTSLAAGMLSLGTGLVSAGNRLLTQTMKAQNTMVMSLEDEFNFITSLGRTLRRGPNRDAMMSVVFEDRVVNDELPSFRRLNIWAHGRRPDRIFFNGRALTADMLINELNAANIELADYDAVRFISCDSVNLARTFTENTTITSTGFRGNVLVQGHTVDALRQLSAEVEHLQPNIARVRFARLVAQYPERSIASGINIFDDYNFFRITRGTPVSFFSLPEEHFTAQREGYPLAEWYGLD